MPALTLAQAARTLGTTTVALRHRIRRGLVRAELVEQGPCPYYLITAEEVERLLCLPRPKRGRPARREIHHA
jgi:hypothetical protein